MAARRIEDGSRERHDIDRRDRAGRRQCGGAGCGTIADPPLQNVTKIREPMSSLFRIPQVSANVRALCAGERGSSIESSAHEFRS